MNPPCLSPEVQPSEREHLLAGATISGTVANNKITARAAAGCTSFNFCSSRGISMCVLNECLTFDLARAELGTSCLPAGPDTTSTTKSRSPSLLYFPNDHLWIARGSRLPFVIWALCQEDLQKRHALASVMTHSFHAH